MIPLSFALALLAAVDGGGPPAIEASAAQIALHKVRQDVAVAELLQGLERASPHGLIVIRNVRVIDPIDASVTPNQSVIVRAPRIAWVGDAAKEPKLPDATVIDGAGRFLAPGLTDMHVHDSAAAGWLLDLGNGVTSVRDMAGFPWLLKARESIGTGRMLGPALTVAGPLINVFPLEGYAVVPADSLDARRLVRQQAACGYDFIKVHNVVPEPVFDAVAAQARALGMDLVGHVPHQISVRHAAAAGMRTMEHLKGYLDDATLEPGETDFAAAVDGPELWITPTLYAVRGNAYGDAARRLLDAPEMRYVPLRKREAWRRALDQAVDDGQKRGYAAGAVMQEIVIKLRGVHAHFLAGTDADGYPFQVMGYALIAELALLEQAGLTPAEALRAATTEAARALRLENEAGRVRRGMRADLVLLDANPLEGVRAFERNQGVMAHGIWLERDRLDAALERLAAIEAESDAAEPLSRPAAASVAARAEALSHDGFVFDATELTAFASQLRERGWGESAAGAEAMADVPKSGPCLEIRPR